MRLFIVAFIALLLTLTPAVSSGIPSLPSEGVRVKRYWGGGMGGMRPPRPPYQGGIGGMGGGMRPPRPPYPGGMGGMGGGWSPYKG